MTLFTVSAIVLLDTLAASASIGVSSLFWWVFLGTIFLLPIGLITAELGTTYPAEGGLYVWIRKAFGRQWATRAVWAYWINTAFWLPAIYILFAGIFAQLFQLPLSIQMQIALGIVLTWLTVGLDVLGLKIGKWIPNLGAAIKLIIFVVLIFGGFRYAAVNGSVNVINAESLTPAWEDGLKFLPVIIYGMLGFELVSAAGDEITNPKRDVPLSILTSGILILVLYFFATAGILAALPANELDIVEGLVDTLALFFEGVPGGSTIVVVLGVGALFTFFSNGATWAMGCNRTTAEAANEGQFPRIFGRQHPEHGGPVGAAIMMGLVCTVALIVYGGLASSNADLFWSLFSFSAVIFMLPYIGLVLAFAKLRLLPNDQVDAFRVPGGNFVAMLLSGICALVLILSIVLFLYVPGEGLQKATLWGVIVVLIVGEILMRSSRGVDEPD